MLTPETIRWIGYIIVFLVMSEILYSMTSALTEAGRRQRTAEEEASQLRAVLKENPTSAPGPGQAKSWRGYRRFILDEKTDEAKDTCSFYIRPLDGELLPLYEPGQHIGFRLRIPGSVRPTVRNYSLSSGPGDRSRYRITVKRIPPPPNLPDAQPGVGSSFLHETVAVGDLLEVSSPAGKFFLDREDPRPAVFIAGGIGVTPLMSMLEAICTEKLDRRIFFIHAARNRNEHAFRDRVQELTDEMDNIDFHIFYSHPEAESELATDRLQQGHVDVSSIQKITGGLDVQYYICGPPPMMGALIPALEASGVATSSILTEAFGPSTRKTAVATEQNVEDKKSPELQIHFGHSDKTFGWTGQTSILEIAEDAGIMIDSSCRSGTCGTCEVRLNHGKVTYEEEPSAEIRDGHCLACVAIPIDDIEIQA